MEFAAVIPAPPTQSYLHSALTSSTELAAIIPAPPTQSYLHSAHSL